VNEDIVSIKEEDKPLIWINPKVLKMKEEIERLKEMKLHTEKYASEMEDKYILEKTKNDKAIEYIESYMPNYDFDKTNLTKVLDILKGVDKE